MVSTKSEEPGKRYRKTVLLGRMSPTFIKQRWRAEERQFCRGNGVNKGRGENSKGCVRGDSAVKWLEVRALGSVPSHNVIYLSMPQCSW